MKRINYRIIIRIALPLALLVLGYFVLRIDFNKYFYKGDKDFDSPVRGYSPEYEAERLAEIMQNEQRALNLKFIDACGEGDLAQVTRLIEEGAAINSYKYKNGPEAIPISHASAKGHLEVVKYLISKGADINKRNEYGITALMAAVQWGHYDVAKYLLDHGADATAVDNGSENVFHRIHGERPIDLIKLLIEKGADPNVADNFFGRTGLQIASDENQVKTLEVMLQHGGQMQKKDKNGYTALHYTAEGHAIDAAELLLDKGAWIDARDEAGNTPLHLAAYSGNIEVMALLVSRGAAINTRNYDNSTPLHYSAERDTIKAAELLIANRADLNLKNNAGATALHIAAHYGYFDIVKLLIEKGSEINAKENQGYTVLDIAEMSSASRRKEIIDFLLKNGAQHGREHPVGPIDQI